MESAWEGFVWEGFEQGAASQLSVPLKAVQEGKCSSPRMSGLPVCANQELYLAWFLLLEEMQG